MEQIVHYWKPHVELTNFISLDELKQIPFLLELLFTLMMKRELPLWRKRFDSYSIIHLLYGTQRRQTEWILFMQRPWMNRQ